MNTAKSSPQRQEGLKTLAPSLSEYSQFAPNKKVNILSIIYSAWSLNAPSKSYTSRRSLLHRVVPVYLMYRPANTVPYATVEADLTGVYQKYSVLDNTGRIDVRTGSGVEQKCCALQHWIFQWTNGNLLLTRLEGRVTPEFSRAM